jgi:glycerol-3-phosphate dehydrogenase (NAD(P)+)
MTNPTSLPIAVLGAGSWGTALAIHLARNHHSVRLWGRDTAQMQQMTAQRCNIRYLPSVPLPTNITIHTDIASAIQDAAIIMIVVPSHGFAGCLQAIKPFYKKGTPIIWATKGIQPDGTLLHELVEQQFGKDTPKALLAGPSFAVEVAMELPTAVVVASDNETCARQIAKVLASPRFRVYLCPDMVGAQLGGAIKNVLAIATGASDGLGFGANARSALITRGLAELMRLGIAMGGQAETFMGLAGLGDLILTCTDDKSRNRRFGLALGRGASATDAVAAIGQVVEGATAAGYVYQLAKQRGVEMPITEQVHRVLNGEQSAEEAVYALLSRNTGFE